MAAAVALLVFGRQPGHLTPSDAIDRAPAAGSAVSPAAPAEARAERPLPPSPEGATATQPAAESGAEGAVARSEPRAVAAAPKAGGAAAKARGVDAEKVFLDDAPGSAGPRAAKPAATAPAKREAQAAPSEESAPQAQDTALKPAAGKTDDGLLPDKPSTGAVQAAIASVMNAARACVAGSSDTTPVTVVFSSNGSVKSVIVNGAVQGTPAGKCIQSALGNAKVAPFAQPAFSVGVSVRP
jgi:hypothetical protein